MTDSPTRKRALEILADPHAKEDKWMGALAILGGKVPSIRRQRFGKKVLRYCKRVGGLTVAYTTLFTIYGMIFLGQPFSLAMLPMVLLWAALEAGFGAFSLLALWVMFTHLGSIVTLSPYYQTTWMVVLLNLMIYAKFNWRPYVFVPVHKMINSAPQMKRLRG